MELKLVGDETRSCVGGAPSVGAIIGGGRVQHLPKFGGLVLDCIEADFCVTLVDVLCNAARGGTRSTKSRGPSPRIFTLLCNVVPIQ